MVPITKLPGSSGNNSLTSALTQWCLEIHRGCCVRHPPVRRRHPAHWRWLLPSTDWARLLPQPRPRPDGVTTVGDWRSVGQTVWRTCRRRCDDELEDLETTSAGMKTTQWNHWNNSHCLESTRREWAKEGQTDRQTENRQCGSFVVHNICYWDAWVQPGGGKPPYSVHTDIQPAPQLKVLCIVTSASECALTASVYEVISEVNVNFKCKFL